jgi:conjugal transfer ATP-binding protein TraC
LANLIPLSGSWKGTKIPKILFENPQGELVNMDLFDPSLPSKHALLIGSTGSGKSFTTNFLLANFLIESDINHVVIIDIGGSYRKLCQLFDGQYLSVDLTDAYAFNPLPEKDAIFDGKDYDPDILAYTILILGRMILDEGEVLNSAGESLLENALKRTYQAGASPTLKDVRSYLQAIKGNEETKSLAAHYANNLEMWTEGRYSRIFNTHKRLAVDNRVIVFDLEKLGHHPRLQSVYFYVIREIIDAKLRAKALKKMIVIDEGWRFFNDDVGSRLIENLYRTARKSNGMILSISQSPVDFLNTKAANAIISNTYVKYVLRLTKGHEHLPQFGFSPGEIEAIKNLHSVPRQFSDVFLKFVEQATTIRIEPSALDYWVCTTDADDTVKEQGIRNAHPEWSHAQVLEELVRQSEKEVKNP